jgi:type IV pilus assembly protein PilY1
VRGTTSNTIDYSSKKGWYMDFINPNDTLNHGERIVSASILRDGRIIFSTLIPIPDTTATDVCLPSSSSTSHVMVLDALTGGRPSTPALGSLMVTLPDGSSVAVSGVQSTSGSMGTPTIITRPDGGQINGSASSGNIEDIKYNPASTSTTGAGRQSWKQL